MGSLTVTLTTARVEQELTADLIKLALALLARWHFVRMHLVVV